MPRGDKTGPAGMGPMTGRSAGYCTGNNMPGFQNAGPFMGQRVGAGQGRGVAGRNFGVGRRGFRNMHHITGKPGWSRVSGIPAPYDMEPDPEQVVSELSRQARNLQNELNRVNEQIAVWSKEKGKESPSG